MSSPTLAELAGWRPAELLESADRLVAAAGAVDDEAARCRRELAEVLDDAGGAWAEAASGRAAEEARDGAALADALAAAGAVLATGAETLAATRGALLTVVDRVASLGFRVADDGRVVAPAAPEAPDSVPPAERLAWSLAPEQQAQAAAVEQQRQALEAEVEAARAAVVAADEALADAVRDVDHPLPLGSRARSHLRRADRLGGDHVAALGAAGGVVVLGQTGNAVRREASRAARLARFASLARAGAGPAEIDGARRALALGTSTVPAFRVAGRLSLPTTIATGVGDVVTGGGYEGARGWATRGFAAAGVVGAGVVLAGAAPALVVAGGVAVVAYGVWSAGNHAVDHWDQVADAWETGERWSAEARLATHREIDAAIGWAHEQLRGVVDVELGSRGWRW